MLWYYTPALLMLLHSTFCFPSEKVTEKPEIPSMVSPNLRRPTHISEFTDPNTGLNPFLDIEEGRTAMGRNVMEDEIRVDKPYFDMDLVEGDAPDRKWSIEEPKKFLGREPEGGPPVLWPEPDFKDGSGLTTPSLLPPNPPTTIEIFITKDFKDVKSEVVEDANENKQKVEKESYLVSQNVVIFATTSIATLTVLILLVVACWWRKKLRTSRSATTVENGDVKS